VNRPAPKDFNFVANVMEEWARRAPDALALWWVDENGRRQRKITVSDIVADAHRVANFLRDSGIEPGDLVLVMLPRIPEWWITLLGLIRLGAIPVPSAMMLTTRDVRYRIEAAGIRAVITDDGGVSKLDWFSGKRILVGSQRPGWTRSVGLRKFSILLPRIWTRSRPALFGCACPIIQQFWHYLKSGIIWRHFKKPWKASTTIRFAARHCETSRSG